MTDPAKLFSRLSDREQEIAHLYAVGNTSRQIADELHISPTTVRNHVATIYKKLAIANKSELLQLVNDSETTQSEQITATSSTPQNSEPVSIPERALNAALAQQRATNDVLRVISHSPGDREAIFDVILDYALELSLSQLGVVYEYDDGAFQATGLKNVPEAFEEYLRTGPIIPGPKTGLGRMTKQHRIIHIHDVLSEDVYRSGDPLRIATADLGGARSFLVIPMLNRDRLLGAFTIYRQEVRPFTDEELTIIQSFSDQAAIALIITRLIDERNNLLEKLENKS